MKMNSSDSCTVFNCFLICSVVGLLMNFMFFTFIFTMLFLPFTNPPNFFKLLRYILLLLNLLFHIFCKSNKATLSISLSPNEIISISLSSFSISLFLLFSTAGLSETCVVLFKRLFCFFNSSIFSFSNCSSVSFQLTTNWSATDRNTLNFHNIGRFGYCDSYRLRADNTSILLRITECVRGRYFKEDTLTQSFSLLVMIDTGAFSKHFFKIVSHCMSS